MESNKSDTAQTASRERTDDSAGGFKANVKQYFNSLPLLTFSVFAIAWLIGIADVPGRCLTRGEIYTFRHWLYLVPDKVVYSLQVHRIWLYPFASPGFLILLTNTYLALPYMATIERKYGTIPLAWHMVALYTCVVGILLMAWNTWAIGALASYGGLSGWTVGLAVCLAKEKEPEGQWNDRMFFGVVRIRAKAMPYFINVLYLLFTRNLSIFAGLLAAGVAHCYFKNWIPSRLLPSENAYRYLESHPRLKRLTSNPRFVSMDAATGGSLPIHMSNVIADSAVMAKVDN